MPVRALTFALVSALCWFSELRAILLEELINVFFLCADNFGITMDRYLHPANLISDKILQINDNYYVQ